MPDPVPARPSHATSRPLVRCLWSHRPLSRRRVGPEQGSKVQFGTSVVTRNSRVHLCSPSDWTRTACGCGAFFLKRKGIPAKDKVQYTSQCPVCGIRRITQNHPLPFVPDFSECGGVARTFRPATPLHLKVIVGPSIPSEHIDAFGCQRICDHVIKGTKVPVCSAAAGE